MKKTNFIKMLVVVATLFMGALVISAAETTKAEAATVYNLVNPRQTDTLLTANDSEATALKNSGWRMIAYYFSPDNSKVPVYRVYNPNSGQHYFTKSAYERNHLINVGWNNEGVAFYGVDSSYPAEKWTVGMFYNSSTGAHAYGYGRNSPLPGFKFQSFAFDTEPTGYTGN